MSSMSIFYKVVCYILLVVPPYSSGMKDLTCTPEPNLVGHPVYDPLQQHISSFLNTQLFLSFHIS